MFSVALLLLLAAGSCVKCEQLTQPDSVTVQPGQRLTITCQVSYDLNSYFTSWIRQPAGKGLEWISRDAGVKDSLKNKFSIDLDSSSKTVTLTGQNVQPEDTAVYYCARYGGNGAFDYWGKGTMVTVTSATSTAPTVFPLMQCGSGTGDRVTLGCFATGFSPSALTFAWNKVDGDALTDFIQYPPVQKGNFYTRVSQIRVSQDDWNARNTFRCAVTHAAGNADASFKKPEEPIVVYRLPTLRVSSSSDEETEVSVSCFAKDFSPNDYEFKWLKDDKEIPDSTYEVITPAPVETKDENGTTLYSTASFLTMTSIEWGNAPRLTCQFKGKGDKAPTYVNASLTIEPPTPCDGCPYADAEITIEGPAMEDIFSEGQGTVKCNVNVRNPSITKIVWENENGDEIPDTVKTFTNGNKGVISVPLTITYEEWNKGTTFKCVVDHNNWLEPRTETYKRSIGGVTRRPSVFMLPLEHTSQGTVTLTCYVKDFLPKEVFVSWLVNDEIANSTYEFHTTNPVRKHDSYSAYGQLSISLDQWRGDDVFSCVVHHESVANTTKAIVRSIGHSFKCSLERTNLVNLNMNIPETCKA